MDKSSQNCINIEELEVSCLCYPSAAGEFSISKRSWAVRTFTRLIEHTTKAAVNLSMNNVSDVANSPAFHRSVTVGARD